MSERPAAYEPKTVVAVEAEPPGWLVQFSCGHAVWCPVKIRVGDSQVCGVCLNEFAKEAFAKGKPTVTKEEADEIEGLLAFANDPGSMRARIAKEHREADERMGRDWNSPQGCGCAACRVMKGLVQ